MIETRGFMGIRCITLACILLLLGGVVIAQSTRPSLTMIKRAGVWPLRTKPTREQKKRLQPDPRDVAKFAELLDQPRTGIVRLLPDLGCYDNMNILKADEVCRNAIPESSFYSFREREHTLEVLSDIRLKNGHLVSDGILTQGMMTNLGDVALDRVSLESDGFDYLRDFAPYPAAVAAKDQYMQLINGVVAGKHEYRKVAKAIENTTYAMRIIAYRGNVIRSFRGWRFDLLEGDKRIDMTLAFRIVRKDSDGSVTIVWKELERRESPRIKFPKKKSDSKPSA
ncbi:MAG: hypothetical protein IPN69_04925 [Acidobacteria bacterium]|nr:hypothetical protein [Acidobacteriota bacterium]